ncbi:rRNA maturation RNase YbeY [Phaeocystidibacter marisrubri]|uniref:Endoribonuclease YbeY n=1 Tax=Phaeocystidibacter marisrubri TaxID=1577780 RepID=A0A6L3ZF78_9FLAO|nr:rRNA maturation RNase YbeY [Phaeocystidibacter marisrubri]KAB2816505.1 rRNA maturation RNase YbeY [Phaeocystidibacter marisrubri]GGH69392.1 endoribonuclease YbeY [Phaeocystidibacter marisrubri]
MSKVRFYNTPSSWEIDVSEVDRWLSTVALMEGLRLVEISYRFLSDDEMRLENVRLLEHDYYTDVITYGEVRGTRIYGDVIVSYERITDNANRLNNSLLDERDRVFVHALLHLCGYDDQSEVDRLKMRKLEDKYLALRSK